jgi:hypothetical protein
MGRIRISVEESTPNIRKDRGENERGRARYYNSRLKPKRIYIQIQAVARWNQLSNGHVHAKRVFSKMRLFGAERFEKDRQSRCSGAMCKKRLATCRK